MQNAPRRFLIVASLLVAASACTGSRATSGAAHPNAAAQPAPSAPPAAAQPPPAAEPSFSHSYILLESDPWADGAHDVCQVARAQRLRTFQGSFNTYEGESEKDAPPPTREQIVERMCGETCDREPALREVLLRVVQDCPETGEQDQPATLAK
ncbi:MAG: hypothetical protein R3B48_26400 [Kofleriaceae bacterium]